MPLGNAIFLHKEQAIIRILPINQDTFPRPASQFSRRYVWKPFMNAHARSVIKSLSLDGIA
jgi:hypothetical protein